VAIKLVLRIVTRAPIEVLELCQLLVVEERHLGGMLRRLPFPILSIPLLEDWNNCTHVGELGRRPMLVDERDRTVPPLPLGTVKTVL